EFIPLFRLPEFLLGMALGRLFVLQKQESRAVIWGKEPRTIVSGRLLPWAALGGILTLLACGNWIPYPFLHNGLLDVLFAVLIYGLANVDSGSGLAKTPARLLSMPVFVLLGEASYAVYILHVPLRKWMYQILEWVNPNVHPSMTIFVAYTLVTLGVSVLVFKLIE